MNNQIEKEMILEEAIDKMDKAISKIKAEAHKENPIIQPEHDFLGFIVSLFVDNFRLHPETPIVGVISSFEILQDFLKSNVVTIASIFDGEQLSAYSPDIFILISILLSDIYRKYFKMVPLRDNQESDQEEIDTDLVGNA